MFNLQYLINQSEADELGELGETFKNLAANSRNLGNVLKADIQPASPFEKEVQRRIIQNNLDAIRYTSPLLVNLSKLVVPLGNPDSQLRIVD